MININEFLQQQYQQTCDTVSDINEHLPVLRDFANRCTHVTEMGVRDGFSSRAFLSSKAKSFRLYDRLYFTDMSAFVEQCASAGIDVQYHIADVLEIEIEPTDMLFIDTWHTYEQLRAELFRHASRVKRFIAFHDTYTFGLKDELPGSGGGLIQALLEYLVYDPNWRFVYHTHRNNGLTILERTNNWCR